MNNVTILRNLARIYVKFHESGQKKFDEKKKKKIRGESKMDISFCCVHVYHEDTPAHRTLLT